MPGNTNAAQQQNFRSFTTAHIPHHERVEFWEAHNAEALIGLDIRPLHTQTLEAQQQNRETPKIRAAKVLGSSQLVERSTQMIRKHPTEAIALFFCTQGDSFYSDATGTHVLYPGQLLACNADSPFIRGFGLQVSEMVLTVSREEFMQLSGGDALTSPKKFTFAASLDTAGHHSAATRLAHLVDHALQAPHELAETFEDETLAWLESLFQAESQDALGLFQQAQYFIDINLHRPDLRRTDLARLLHVSERQIARIFAANDTSFSRELVVRRVRSAQSLLINEPNTPIAEIAQRCGFRSTAYFSRAFRSVIGRSPSDERAQRNA
jgi:AraC-like DNA-binding protein